MSLEDAPEGYELFNQKQDGCIKVVLKPGTNGNGSQSKGNDEVLH
jgi:hypothetical protein